MGLSTLAVVLLGISSAFALKSRISAPEECPLVEPPLPVHGCYWVPIRDVAVHSATRGCLLRYSFKCLKPLPENCGDPMPPPDRRLGCAYISVHDSDGCIVNFECEPDTCEEVREPKEEGCLYIPRRDGRGCLTDYQCIPAPPRALPNSQLDEAPVPADVESVEALDFETPQRDDIVTLDGSDEDMEPQVELLPERTMRKQSTTKVLKDSVLFSGVKPGFGFPLAAPAAPILAPRPALAVQPVVPIRAPPVPIVRTAFIPRIAPACPPFPPKPLDSDHCTWVPVKDNRHCVRQWECDPVPAPPIRCPRAPIKPEVGDRCNWIPILDKNNCIRKYECEPIPPEPCPPAPLPPDDHDQCKWVSIKDANGCIMDYECVPIGHNW